MALADLPFHVRPLGADKRASGGREASQLGMRRQEVGSRKKDTHHTAQAGRYRDESGNVVRPKGIEDHAPDQPTQGHAEARAKLLEAKHRTHGPDAVVLAVDHDEGRHFPPPSPMSNRATKR